MNKSMLMVSELLGSLWETEKHEEIILSNLEEVSLSAKANISPLDIAALPNSLASKLL